MLLDKFNKLRIAIRYWLYGKEYYKSLEAMNFAARYHTGIRKDKITPEFHHQISIASYLRTLPSLKFQEEVLAVAFLHDVVEDYDVPLKTIEVEFGEQIATAVKLLTKTDKHMDIYFNNISSCPIASIVKGADRIHNVQTMVDVFTFEKQTRYIQECTTLILPMLKSARYNFASQEPAYENIKMVLESQIELINKIIRGSK